MWSSQDLYPDILKNEITFHRVCQRTYIFNNMDSFYHIQRANQLYELQRYEACFTEARQALQYDTQSEIAYHLMVLSLIQLKRFEEAKEWSQESLSHHPDSDILIFSLGILNLKQDNYVRAKECIEAAIKINPMNELYYFNLAKCYLQFEQLQHADTLLKKCLNLNPNNEYALNLKSQIEAHLNKDYNSAEAFRTLSKAMHLAPENAHNHFVKANYHWKMQQTDQAEFHYQEAMRLDPMNEEARALWMEVRSRRIPFWENILSVFPVGSKSIFGAFLLLGLFTFPPNLFFLINMKEGTIAYPGYILCFLALIPAVAFWVIRPLYKFKSLNQKWNKTTVEVSNPSLPIEVLSCLAILSSILLWIFQKEIFFGSWFVSMLLGFILVQERSHHTSYPIFKKPIKTSLIALAIVFTLVAFGKIFEEEETTTAALPEKIETIVDLSNGKVNTLADINHPAMRTVLKLDNNNLNEVPEAVANYKKLFFLSLKNNNIEEIPRFVYEIKSIRFLDLEGNPITGEEWDRIKTEMPEVTLGPMEYVAPDF